MSERSDFERGALAMKVWVVDMLDRYSYQAEERGDHRQACHFIYASGKARELPLDEATLSLKMDGAK